MDNAGAKLKKEHANASQRNYLDESDSSSMHDSDLDLWCFGWTKTKHKKHSKPDAEIKRTPKYEANKSAKLESKEEHTKIEQKKVERQKAENNLSQLKPIDLKTKEDLEYYTETEKAKKRKSLISRISLKKETKSNESSAYHYSDTFYEDKNENNDDKQLRERETRMKENLTNISVESKKPGQDGKTHDVKKPTKLSDVEQETKKQRRTLGSLFSLKKDSRSKESTDNYCSDVCYQDYAKSGANKKQENASSDVDEGKTTRRSLGSYFNLKKESQNITSQENTEKEKTKRSIGSLFSLKRASRSNEISSTEGINKTRATLLSRLSFKKDAKIKTEPDENKETGRVEQQTHKSEAKKPVSTLKPIPEVSHAKSNTIEEENKSYGLIAESYYLKKSRLPAQIPCSDRSSVEETSSVIKVENLSKETIQQKPFGLLSDEEQLTELAKNQKTKSPPIPPNQQPLLTTIKQERFSEPLETETKTIYVDESFLKKEPSYISTDLVSIKKEEFTYDLIEDPNRSIKQEEKDSSILPVKKEEHEATFPIEYVKPSTSSKVNKNIQTDVMDSEGDSPQRACDPPFERSFGIQTDPYRFDYLDSSEKMLPMEKNSTSKHVQTDCVCNNDSSIERMNIRERERAARTGSRKENKAVQTDICMCNYVSTSDDDNDDYDD